MHKPHLITALLFVLSSLTPATAQEAFVEVSGTASDGSFAPLWLTSNRQGVPSPYANSAYQRIGGSYDLDLPKDTAHSWHLSFAADLMLAQNAQYKFFVHQLFAEARYKKATLTIGQKERSIDLRNNSLTSGGLSQGINAQPIPEVLLSVDYFSIPLTNHWLKARGRIGFGKTTDGAWQKEWVGEESKKRYTSNTLYHEKSIALKIGREEIFPLTFEPSLQMMTQFGGTSYNAYGRNHADGAPIKHPEDLNAFWHAFWPMGSEDVTDGLHPNSAGNTVGSYNIALTWNAPTWKARAYFERVFEDQSMLTVQYGIFDHLLGIDCQLPANPYISNILVEHLSTTDQAGPVYHDSTPNIPESYTGIDNYYNHGLYSGWQNWGVSMGTPLITSPIYNDNNTLQFYNNRVKAWHIGIDGNPTPWLSWRMMATFTRNWGTYAQPYDDILKQQYYLAELTTLPPFAKGWKATLSLGLDHGEVIGNSVGAQLTIRKTFSL